MQISVYYLYFWEEKSYLESLRRHRDIWPFWGRLRLRFERVNLDAAGWSCDEIEPTSHLWMTNEKLLLCLRLSHLIYVLILALYLSSVLDTLPPQQCRCSTDLVIVNQPQKPGAIYTWFSSLLIRPFLLSGKSHLEEYMDTFSQNQSLNLIWSWYMFMKNVSAMHVIKMLITGNTWIFQT